MVNFGVDEELVQFISGLTADGHVAARSFATWTGGTDSSSASFGVLSSVRKWGGGAPGTPATVIYGFDAGSHWTASEQAAFVAAMHLWQAEAGISFVAAAPGAAPQLSIVRSHTGKAEGYLAGSSAPVGAATIGTASHAVVEIDTSVTGFGPIGASFAAAGGYPWTTVEHELGHALGLGHPGFYNGNDARPWQNGSEDTRARTIMSYFDPEPGRGYDWTAPDGTRGEPVTPQPLDIGALQRLYGPPVGSPLGAGTVFGFNSTVAGDLRPFFDFSINTRPVVTLFATGGPTTLDLSGFATASVGSLRDDLYASISAGGLQQNIAIAGGTQVDTVLLGAGDDRIQGNNDAGNLMLGGAGADQLAGGTGNDHLYGYGPGAAPDDGADRLNGGDGNDYLQGNGGADQLDGGYGDDRLYGGSGDDLIQGGTGNDIINGNRGNDTIHGGDGADYIRGGQGDDVLQGRVVLGDLGDDRVEADGPLAQLMGGDGRDIFVIAGREGQYATQGPNAYRVPEITDFASGTDHLHLDMGRPTQIITLAAQADLASAAAAAAAVIGTGGYFDGLFTTVVDVQVGADTALFFWQPAVGMEGLRLDGLAAGRLTADDFT